MGNKFAIVLENSDSVKNGKIKDFEFWDFIGWNGQIDYYDIVTVQSLSERKDGSFKEIGIDLYVEDTLEDALYEAGRAQGEFVRQIKILELRESKDGTWIPHKIHDVPEQNFDER